MAHIVNNNSTVVKNTTVNKTFNSAPRRSLGRGGLYGVDTANSWFGGVVDTLTGFGVFKFFFLAFLFLVFLRTLFSASVPEGARGYLDFEELLNLLNSVQVIDYSWIDKFSDIMTHYTLPNMILGQGGVLLATLDIVNKIFNTLWYPVKAILYMLTAVMKFSEWLGVIFNWFMAW